MIGAGLFKAGLVALGLLSIVQAKLPVPKGSGSTPNGVTEPHGKIYIVILPALLLTALSLRLFHLGNGLWYDEIITYVNYGRIPLGQIVTTYDSENLHVLFALLANMCLRVFGESDGAMRLPAVFFGVGSIWGIYLLGRRVGTAREGLLAAAILTFSYQHIWFSQNARGYTMLLFWAILSSWLFLHAARKGNPTIWLAYAVSAALGAYTHLTMVYAVMGHFIIYAIMFLRDEGKKRRGEGGTGFFYGFCIAAVLSFQLYALVIPQMLSAFGEGMRSNVAVWKSPLWTLWEFGRGAGMGVTGAAVALTALLVGVAGIGNFLRQNPVVLGFAVLPVLIGTIVSLVLGHPLWPRFFFFAAGFWVLIAVRGTMVLGKWVGTFFGQPKRSVLIGTALCCGLIGASALSIPYAYAPKQDYHGALIYVEQNRRPGDAVATVGVTTDVPYRKFYQTNWERVKTVSDLNAVQERAQRTWLVYTLSLHLESEYPELMRRIKERYQIVQKFGGTLNDGTIYVCLSKG